MDLLNTRFSKRGVSGSRVHYLADPWFMSGVGAVQIAMVVDMGGLADPYFIKADDMLVDVLWTAWCWLNRLSYPWQGGWEVGGLMTAACCALY